MMKTMKKKSNRLPRLTLALLILGLFTALAGCGSSKSAETVAETMAYPADMKNEMQLQETAAAEPAAMTDQALSDASGISQTLPADRKLIRDVDMNVESTEFEKLISQITSKVTELGGYIETSNISGVSVNSFEYGERRHANITARVPGEKLNELLQAVETSGNITNKSESVTDVTLQYSDIESHKKSLTVEQERLWSLLEKADTLEAVIALEARLSEIRYQLEAFESQLRLYDNQVAYSTVTLNISEVKHFTPAAPDTVGALIQKGISRSLTQISDAGINLFVWVISNSPILLLLGVILFIIILILKKAVKKQRNPFYEHSDFEEQGKKTEKNSREEE